MRMLKPMSIVLLIVMWMICSSRTSAEDVKDDPASTKYYEKYGRHCLNYNDGDSVWSVSLTGQKISKEDLTYLNGFPHLEQLEIDDSDATDGTLEMLVKLNLKSLNFLDLSGTQISDAGIVHLKAIPELSGIFLNRTKVTDAGLVHLEGLHKLSWLSLSNEPDRSFTVKIEENGVKLKPNSKNSKELRTSITDAGLKSLSESVNLEFLNLTGTDITDEGMGHLRKLINMKRLLLSDTSISDEGLKFLNQMNQLETVFLNDTMISDAGMSHLIHMKKLKSIWIEDTNITDEGMKHLSRFPQLEDVGISRTKVTNAGLKHIAHLKNLKMIFAAETSIDRSGIEPIRENSEFVNLYKE